MLTLILEFHRAQVQTRLTAVVYPQNNVTNGLQVACHFWDVILLENESGLRLN